MRFGAWGFFLNFSIEIGTCPSSLLSQVNACWDQGANLLGERNIVNLLQSLPKLRESVIFLLF